MIMMWKIIKSNNMNKKVFKGVDLKENNQI
jgi:hypothetical protein